jgi:hypothetical protein
VGELTGYRDKTTEQPDLGDCRHGRSDVIPIHIDGYVRATGAPPRGPLTDGVALTDGGHDRDSYLFPVAQRLGPQPVAAICGRKIHGPSSLAVGPAQPDPARATAQFPARMAGSYARREWKQQLYDRLAVQAAIIDPGPAGLSIALATGPARNWASLCKPLTGAFGPVPGQDPPGRSTPTMTVSSASLCITPPAPASPTT